MFLGCPTTPNQNNYDYLRSPITFRIDTVPAAHSYCSQSQTLFPSVDSCQLTKKYALRWEPPQDTTGFLEYRVYLDTSPSNAFGKAWSEVRKDRSLASAIIPGVGGSKDSLIIVFDNSGFRVNTIQHGETRIISFDTSGRIDAQGRLVFALVAAYRESGQDGQPRYTWIITNDRFSPFPIQPAYTRYDTRVEIDWSRPPDPTSFFNPGADSGVIRQYVLRVTRGSILNGNRTGIFSPAVHYENNGVDWSDRVQMDTFTTTHGYPGRRFILPDSQHAFDIRLPDPRDSLKAIVSGLSPQDTVDFGLWAVDASGNVTDSSLATRVILTDTTEPVAPILRLIDYGRNKIIYSFTAARDRVERNGLLVPADSANANILEYHLTRRLISGSAGGIASKDSIVTVTGKNRRDTLFVDTARYLPPGATYRIYAQAMDSTGHLSQRDSLDASTLAVNFTGPDSASSCPPGFVPIPAGKFTLGNASADLDERPAQSRYLGSYCIENYEHRDNSGSFQTRRTWQDADSICLALSPSDSSHLCSEAEWERACKGPDSPPMTYGFQSEDSTNPNAIFNVCNIGTGDSTMAATQSLRNPSCLTSEGVFDMSGNLAEWVLDPYSQGAYQTPDTILFPGHPLVPPSDTGLHGFRGGYYLYSHLPTATILHSARCSNRDYPTQIRPLAYPGCMDSAQPLVVILYNTLSPRCIQIPDSLRNRIITKVSPSSDSTKILFLVDGVAQPIIYTLPTNPVYNTSRPIEAKLTLRTLAAVSFVNSKTGELLLDTLDATEMTDTSEATLSAIFNREVAPPWSALRVNGRYVIKFLYAYSKLHNVPARRDYSNTAIGFRCCSLPRPRGN